MRRKSAENRDQKWAETAAAKGLQGLENAAEKNAKGFLRVEFSKKMQHELFSSEHAVR